MLHRVGRWYKVNALEGHSFLPPWVTAAPVTYGCKKKGAAGLLEQCPEPPKPAMAPACWQLPCPQGEGPCAQRDRGQCRRGLQVGRASPAQAVEESTAQHVVQAAAPELPLAR